MPGMEPAAIKLYIPITVTPPRAWGTRWFVVLGKLIFFDSAQDGGSQIQSESIFPA